MLCSFLSSPRSAPLSRPYALLPFLVPTLCVGTRLLAAPRPLRLRGGIDAGVTNLPRVPNPLEVGVAAGWGWTRERPDHRPHAERRGEKEKMTERRGEKEKVTERKAEKGEEVSPPAPTLPVTLPKGLEPSGGMAAGIAPEGTVFGSRAQVICVQRLQTSQLPQPRGARLDAFPLGRRACALRLDTRDVVGVGLGNAGADGGQPLLEASRQLARQLGLLAGQVALLTDIVAEVV